MRPIQLPRRRLRASLAALTALAALLAATVGPAAAADPGPLQVPALTGFVTNACTGFPIMSGLSVGVTRAVPVGVDPGPLQQPPGPINFGLFTYPTLDPGPINLTVSAPGYVALGASAAGGSPGVTITRDPGPILFPDGASFASGLLLDIRLVPTFPPNPCRASAGPLFPALIGRGVDAATGRGLAGLSVGAAPIVVDPTTGQQDPGPINLPSSRPLLGLFVFRDPGPGQFGFQFYAAAPGHTSLGVAPGVNPGPIGFGPGVLVMADPGPMSLTGSGAVNVSVVIGVALPVGPAGG
jgi:hypothetical protein